jgi:4-alpha-glucanotransferase
MPRLDPTQKLAGLLVPVFSLRHKRDFGIGDTIAVREAIDFCAATGFSVLQLLPIYETVGDHSPYNPISSRALSPALLALTPEEVPGLSAEEVAESAPDSWLAQLRLGAVKQNSVQPLKLQLLLAAHRKFRVIETVEGGSTLAKEFEEFQKAQESWLPAYTLFRTLIREYEGNPNWQEWRPEHQELKTAEAWLARHPERTFLSVLREGFAFVQWVAWRQWRKVRAYADDRGVCLMGEISFGVSRVSVDVWASRELFDLEWNMGTRPVAYFDTNKDSEKWGQNWGLPAYRWENHRSTKFAWLRSRVTGASQYFTACRIDHLRGYFRGYMFPWPGGAVHAEFAKLNPEEAKERTGGRLPRFVPGSDDDPVTAKMNDLQGRELIGVMREAAGEMQFVAEIMGDMPDYMHQSLEDLELASLTFPQLERNADRTLRAPETYRVRSLAAYGNHDHAPIASWYLHLVEKAKADVQSAADLTELLRFLGWTEPTPPKLDDALLATMQRKLFSVPCYLTVLMSSDLLGTAQRFNLPGSYGAGTWSERLEHPLGEYASHPLYGPRLQHVREALAQSGRTASMQARTAAA